MAFGLICAEVRCVSTFKLASCTDGTGALSSWHMRASEPFSSAVWLSVAIAAGSIESTFLLSAPKALAACSADPAVPTSTLRSSGLKLPSGCSDC
jgi:hypothetical protein